LSRDINPEMAAQVGRLTGAAVVVTGRVFRASDGGRYPIVAQILSTATTRAYTETVEGHRDGKNFRLPAAITELNQKIIELIVTHAADFTAPSRKSRDERLAEIVQLAKGRGGPRCRCTLPGLCRKNARPNSTVETELGLIFQRAGFTVVDEKSTQAPEIEVSGEVTAEFGARRGPLFPCRATINLRVREAPREKSSPSIANRPTRWTSASRPRSTRRSKPPPMRSPRGWCRG